MKNSLRILLTATTTISLLLAGCSAEPTEAIEATEFLNDETEDQATDAESGTDTASADQSIVVLENLSEPEFEATENGDAEGGDKAIQNADGSTATGDASGTGDSADGTAAVGVGTATTADGSAATDDATATGNGADAATSGDTTTSDKAATADTSKTNDSSDKSSTDKKSSDSDKDSKDKKDEKEEEKKDDKVEIVFFGDSQTAGGRKDDTDFATYVGERVPNSVVYNLGIGGTTGSVEATTTEVDPSVMHSTSFLGMTYCLAGKSDREATLTNNPEVLEIMNRIDPEKVDYYFIGYGTNDFINNVKLDTSTYDTDGEQAHAFFNAMCKGIDVLSEISPNAQFIIITPFYGIYVTDEGAYVGDSYIVSNGTGTLADYARKAINVAEDKGLYYFDGMFISKCDLYLDTADAYLLDNLHLNVTGRQIMGRLLAHYVNYLEKNEPYAYLETDFIKIAEFNPDEDYRCDEHLMRTGYPESWAKYIKGEFPLAQPSKEALEKYGDSSKDDKKED